MKKSEKYILEHYKFVNDKEFKKYYLRTIETSLKEKKAIESFTFVSDKLLLISFCIMIMSTIISHFIILQQIEIVNNALKMYKFLLIGMF